MPQLSENDLLKACIALNRKAQYELYERYKTAMFSTLYRMLGNKEEAQDALQDGFVQVFMRLTDFRQQSTLGAWIKTIMIRQAIGKLRKTNWTTPLDSLSTDTPFVPPDSLEGQQIETYILALPEGCRAVFLLVEVEGYSHKEVAEMLQISEGTSKSQLSYAKKLLRKTIENEK